MFAAWPVVQYGMQQFGHRRAAFSSTSIGGRVVISSTNIDGQIACSSMNIGRQVT